MQEAKHTPDDWEVKDRKLTIGIDDEASRRLFAAAPDLLEALGELVEGLAGESMPSADEWPAGARARAAIAKATGGEAA